MRRWMFILLGCLVALLACTRELDVQEPAEGPGTASVEGKPVTIEFELPGFSPETKGLGEGGELHSLHLAVFGGSGYLKEYVEATLLGSSTYTYTTTDKLNNPVSHTVPCYRYSVILALSDSPRTVHFLGNGPSVLPFGYDTAVMPVQLSANGEMGYWQMLSLPEGIKAQRNSDGDFIDKNGNVIPDGGTGYIADKDTERAFQGIPLIRNWSKIVLEADENSNFTPVSFSVVNVPTRGSMAPYSAETGFITEYQDRGFTWLEDTVEYPGNLPVGTTFKGTIPPASSFVGPVFGEGVADANTGAVYLYERPAPSSRVPASYVIIYGHYYNPDDPEHEGDYYYKVDLMETKKIGESTWLSRYYPIYRNFKYRIIIKKILSQGHQTPAAAAASAGSADVSADINTGHLSDISDGVGRLHVSPWMSQTFTREYDEEHPVDVLQAYFAKDTSGEPDMDASSVTVSLLEPEDGGSDILYNLSIDPPSNETDSKGWRTIHFCSAAPGRTVRSQAIRITGTHEFGRLYRDVLITVQPIQPMRVSCDQPRIAAAKGTPESVTISIPDGLVESMFPLEFTIEPENRTLTPDNSYPDNNLPVVYGTSISETEGYVGKLSFQFVRTLSWEEYLGLSRVEDEEEQVWRSFTCYFKTNCDENATRVWVYNKYFDKENDSFGNIHDKIFKNLGFTIPIPKMSDVEIPLHFEMVEDTYGTYPDDYPVITISPRGLRLVGEGVEPGDEPGTYFYKPTGHNVDLTFISTTSYAEEFAVDLMAAEYHPGHVETYRFRDVKFVDGHPLSTNAGKWSNSAWSNVAWGYVNRDLNKNVLFGYKDDPGQPNTPVTLKLTNLSLLQSQTYPITPSGPRSSTGDENYHEIELKTSGAQYADAELSISSRGYVTEHIRAGRFAGNIRTMKLTNGNVFKSDNAYSFTRANPRFSYEEDNGKCHVEFSEISAETNGYVTLAAGGTYTIEVSTLDGKELFYLDLWFSYSTSNKVLYTPSSIVPSVGEVFLYPGDNRQYVWSIPRGQTSATLTLTAPASHDIRLEMMYVKSFNKSTDGKGGFYENGVKVD